MVWSLHRTCHMNKHLREIKLNNFNDLNITYNSKDLPDFKEKLLDMEYL